VGAATAALRVVKNALFVRHRLLPFVGEDFLVEF
jgi:hypothetical protein